MKPTASIAALFNRSGSGPEDVGAAAMPVVSRDANGSGAPSSARLRSTLAVLALAIAAFGVTAASAAAAPLAAKVETISSVSYTSARVTGKISTPGEGAFGGPTPYSFWFSTDQTNWTPGPGGTIGGFAEPGPLENKEVEGDFTGFGLESATKYYVRLTARNNGNEVESPLPNPDFTTLAVDPPTIPGTVEASGIFSASATATAKVKRPANPTQPSTSTATSSTSPMLTSSPPDFAGATPVDCAQNPIGEARRRH